MRDLLSFFKPSFDFFYKNINLYILLFFYLEIFFTPTIKVNIDLVSYLRKNWRKGTIFFTPTIKVNIDLVSYLRELFFTSGLRKGQAWVNLRTKHVARVNFASSQF